MTYAQSEDTDQPWHLPSLISRRCPHEEPCTFSYPLSAQSSLGAQKKKLITEKKMCGPLSMGQSSKGGKQKLFYFWPKHHEHDIKMKLKILLFFIIIKKYMYIKLK